MKRKILVFSPFMYWQLHGQVDALLGGAMSLRGADVVPVGCNWLFNPCPMDRGLEEGQPTCSACRHLRKGIFATFGLEWTVLNEFLTPDDVREAEEWVAEIPDAGLLAAEHGGFPLGNLISANLATHFRIGPAHVQEPHVVKVARSFLRGAFITRRGLERLLSVFPADAAVLFNGRFYPHRVAFEVLRAHGVDVIVHERGRVPGSFCFRENMPVFDWQHERERRAAWEKVPLAPDEVGELREYFVRRRGGQGDTLPSFYTSHSRCDVRETLNIPRDARIVGAFTSSQDELSVVLERMGGGRDLRQATLLESLYAVYRGRDEYVVVRHHPHIAGVSFTGDMRDRSFLDAMAAVEAQAPPNFRFVQPGDERIRSYDLFPELSAAFAPFTSVATELMAAGVPTAVHSIGEGLISGFVTLDSFAPGAVAGAAEALHAADGRLNVGQITQAMRNAYTYIFRSSVRLKAVSIVDHFQPDIRINSLDDLRPGQDPVLDRICDRLAGGEGPLHLGPTEAHLRRAVDEERRALDGLLHALRDGFRDSPAAIEQDA